jgi:hypothetical protein
MRRELPALTLCSLVRKWVGLLVGNHTSQWGSLGSSVLGSTLNSVVVKRLFHFQTLSTSSPAKTLSHSDGSGVISIEYIQNKAGKLREPDAPFALVVSTNPPHMDYHFVPERYRELYAELDIEDGVCRKPQVPPKGSRWGDYFRENIRDQYAMVTCVGKYTGRRRILTS